MIDELLDSLVLNRPRAAEELRKELSDLCRGAADLEPILHSFQDKEFLRIGVRDILGKDSIRATAAELSDLAEVILAEVAERQAGPLEKRFGIPYLEEGERAGQRCRFVMLALGKLGGRELNYHSDLDLMLIYEGDGRTKPPPGATRFDRYEATDNFHFFTELAQHIIPRPAIWGRWAVSIRLICGCGRRADPEAWCCRWPSFAATSRPHRTVRRIPIATLSCGSGKP